MPRYPALLIEKAGLTLPAIGLYDAPDASAFEPLVRPAEGRWACVYMPDQLSLFITAAYYYQGRPTPPRVTAPFASGCGQLGPLFEDLEQPQAMLSATDIAMRKYLPSDILAFTVTRPMYEQFCTLDEKSFLGKPFWRELKKAREGKRS